MDQPLSGLTPEQRGNHDRCGRRQGLRHFGIDLKESEIDALIRKGLLPRESRMDRAAVRNALYGFLDRTLREPL
jgi:hypothetical protein